MSGYRNKMNQDTGFKSWRRTLKANPPRVDIIEDVLGLDVKIRSQYFGLVG